MRSKKGPSRIHDKMVVNVLQKKLLQWTCERHATNQPLNHEILSGKLIDISIELGLKNFKFSKTWVTRFLRKHGFSPSLTPLRGPIFDDYKQWIELVRPYIMQYRYKNLFHVDEMGMYHDILPNKVPQSGDCLTCENGEDGESRVTVLLCCNASGVEKLPVVICGRFKNRLPPDDNYQFYANQNAWLTPDLFKIWLTQLNTKMSQSNRKILLLLNRTRAHMLEDTVLSNVTLMFLPEKFPPNLQPLKANIFHHVKMMYRRSYAKKMLQPNFNWTLTDTINSIVNSWNSIPQEFILSSFRRTNFRSDNDFLQISCPQWEDLSPGIPFRNYVTFDDNLCVSSSTIRRSKRLAKIKTVGNSERRFAQAGSREWGRHELIELGDSDSEENVAEEVSHSSKITKVDRDLSSQTSFKYIPRRENKNANKTRSSEPEIRDSDSNCSNCSVRDRRLDRSDLTDCARPFAEKTVLYIADIPKTEEERSAIDIPDVVKLTSGFESQTGTGDVVNRLGVEEDVETAPITRKRHRGEETNEEDGPNDESREQTEKRFMGEEKTWSDIFEHIFVFGTLESPRPTTSALTNVQTTLLHPGINLLRKNDDVEKKSIFTISHGSSSRPQNQ